MLEYMILFIRYLPKKNKTLQASLLLILFAPDIRSKLFSLDFKIVIDLCYNELLFDLIWFEKATIEQQLNWQKFLVQILAKFLARFLARIYIGKIMRRI